MIIDKATARKTFLSKRKALSSMEQSKLNDLLLIQFQRLDLPNIDVLFNYLPIKSKAEPNSYLFSHYLQFLFPALQIAYPITDMETNTMQAYAVDEDTEYEQKAFGLIEPISDIIIPPSAIDLVIVPLLVADTKGFRVGYGKGMYDKFLSLCRKDVFKIGFSFFDPIDKISDTNENDISLDVLVCPNKVYHF